LRIDFENANSYLRFPIWRTHAGGVRGVSRQMEGPGVEEQLDREPKFIAYTKSCQETADTIQSIHMHMQHITKY